MARCDVIFSNTGHPMHFYNVEKAVGRGSLNETSDVLLVQYMLKATYESSTAGASLTGAPKGVLKVSGVADELTFDLIRHFQKSMQKLGIPTVDDGRIDPVPRSTTAYDMTKRAFQHTIISLNHALHTVRPNDYPRLWNAPDCPPALRERLFIYWVAGEYMRY